MAQDQMQSARLICFARPAVPAGTRVGLLKTAQVK